MVFRAPAQLSHILQRSLTLRKGGLMVFRALAQLSPHTLKVTDLEERRPDGVKSPGPAEASVS